MKSHISPIDDSVDPKNMPPGTRVYIYVRISPGDNQTAESQENALVAFCREKGWVIVRIFRDLWVSGGTTTNRDGFEYLAYLARQDYREAEMIVFWDFSRFGRNQQDAQFYVAEMRMNHWILLSLKDDIPGGSMSGIFEALIFWKNEQFLKDLKRHTIRGLVNIAMDGCLPVGNVAKGYTSIDIERNKVLKDGSLGKGRKPKIDPGIAPLVIKAFEMKAQGATHKAIATVTGLFAPTSGSWNHLFCNKAYIGEYEFNGQVFTNVYPPIISKELFDAAQKHIVLQTKRGKRSYHPRRKGSSFFLANISVCKYCGSAMEGKSVHGHRYYVCSQRNTNTQLCQNSGLIPAGETEQEIIRVLLQHILPDESLENLLSWTNKLLNSNLDEFTLQFEKVQSDYELASSQARKCALNFGLMDSPSQVAQQLLHDLEAKADLLEGELQNLRMKIRNSRIEVSPKQIQELSTHYQALIDHGEYFDLREVVEKLCSRIVMAQDECQIEVHFPVAA